MAGTDMSAGMAMPRMQTWGVVDLALLFVMWAVMMVAMMVPSASPLILMTTAAKRKRRERHDPLVSTGLFLAGYLLVWTAFSAVATRRPMGAAHDGAALTRHGQRQSRAGRSVAPDGRDLSVHHAQAGLSDPLPLAAGVRDGTLARGSGRRDAMGLEHGLYCVGCCWVLMALLFVAGVMNLLWVAVISLFVLAEKVLPRGELVGRLGGAALLVAGVVVLTSAV